MIEKKRKGKGEGGGGGGTMGIKGLLFLGSDTAGLGDVEDESERK